MPPNFVVQCVIFQSKKKLMTETKSITPFINHYTVCIRCLFSLEKYYVRSSLNSYISLIKLSYMVLVSIGKVLHSIEPKFVCITDKTKSHVHALLNAAFPACILYAWGPPSNRVWSYGCMPYMIGWCMQRKEPRTQHTLTAKLVIVGDSVASCYIVCCG